MAREDQVPTVEPGRRLRDRDLRATVEAACFDAAATDAPAAPYLDGRVGLETELLPLRRGAGGSNRLRMPEVHAVLDRLAAHPASGIGAAERSPDGTVRYPLDGGGDLTFEPGAQIEVSGPCLGSAAAALDHLGATVETVALAFAAEGVTLASAGTDVWSSGEVPQQLAAARYPAMASYFDERSAWGPVMMRNTCSLQVNLDLGRGAVARDRYAVALLAAPLTVATFACSPEAPGERRTASRRATAWRHLDPTRTGVPRAFVAGESDPATVMVDAALSADVLLVRHDDGTATAGTPGWTFETWMRQGHATHGWPTVADLRYHLTTLFHEARPRGAVELRGVDALPPRWRAVPVVLLTGLLYDAVARDRSLAILEPHRSALPQLLTLASGAGLSDPALCALAVEIWSFALEGARRLPDGAVRPHDILAAERFIDRFTTRGRAPTDELRDLLAHDPAVALAWASEPIPSSAEVRP